MADLSRVWKDLCGRLGVQPRQFAALLTVMVVAVGGLGIKMVAGGPRKASASASAPSKPASAGGSTAKRSSSDPKRSPNTSTTRGAGKTAGEAARRVIEVVLDHNPARDPFRPWGLPEATETVAAAAVKPSGDAIPGYLPGVVLKAVVSGELAVFGDQTVRVGDAVALPDGTFARVLQIRARTVAVDWNGRSLDVNFGAAPQPKNPAPGGFR